MNRLLLASTLALLMTPSLAVGQVTFTWGQCVAAEQRFRETSRQMDGPNFASPIEDVISRAGTNDMPWNLADSVVYGLGVSPETRAAYRTWRAAKLAQPSTENNAQSTTNQDDVIATLRAENSALRAENATLKAMLRKIRKSSPSRIVIARPIR
jgi:hypothetical protein